MIESIPLSDFINGVEPLPLPNYLKQAPVMDNDCIKFKTAQDLPKMDYQLLIPVYPNTENEVCKVITPTAKELEDAASADHFQRIMEQQEYEHLNGPIPTHYSANFYGKYKF